MAKRAKSPLRDTVTKVELSKFNGADMLTADGVQGQTFLCNLLNKRSRTMLVFHFAGGRVVIRRNKSSMRTRSFRVIEIAKNRRVFCGDF